MAGVDFSFFRFCGYSAVALCLCGPWVCDAEPGHRVLSWDDGSSTLPRSAAGLCTYISHLLFSLGVGFFFFMFKQVGDILLSPHLGSKYLLVKKGAFLQFFFLYLKMAKHQKGT